MVRFLEDVMEFIIEFIDTIYNSVLRAYCYIFGHDWFGVVCLRCGKGVDW